MDWDGTELDELYFTELVDRFSSHSEWELQDDGEAQVERSVEAVETGRSVEYWLDHVETDGKLRMELPTQRLGTGIAYGELVQALDRRQQSNPSTDPFLSKLIEAHSGIADRHAGEYVTPESDPATIAILDVPADYDSASLDSAMTAVSDASREVQQLHDDVIDVLNRYSGE